MKPVLPILLMCILLLSPACHNEMGCEPSDLTLMTRAQVGTVAPMHRLLVFGDASGGNGNSNACLFNYAFVSGSRISPGSGTYRFVTLGNADCLELPAAGTTDGIGFDGLLPLKSGATLGNILASQPEKVVCPDTRVYTASLRPATCLLKLTLQDAPEDIVLKLKNMPSGLSFSGTYTNDEAFQQAYPLQEGENVCLPTAADAQLQYETDGTTGVLDLGVTLEAGYTYQIPLQWQAGKIGLSSEVTIWNSGENTIGSAD